MNQVETMAITSPPQNGDFIITIYTKFLEFLVTSPALGTLIIVMFFVAIFAAMTLTAITLRVKHQADANRGIEMTLSEMTTTLINMHESVNDINGRMLEIRAVLGERCVKTAPSNLLLPGSKE